MSFQEICVLGLGYIGLPTASTLATHGMQVAGVDIDPRIVATLRNGGIHIHEPGLRTLVQAAFKSGNLIISEKPVHADAFIIAVPTPILADKKADLRYVRSAAEAIVPFLKAGNLVVLESTSPPRTTVDVVAPLLERSGLTAGEEFYLAYSPERVLPGQILRELIENARVIGGINHISSEAGRDLYKTFVRGEIILTDATSAEMVKLMENTQRDVNIAIANEFSRLADRFGIDVWEAIAIANRHPRVEILKPGAGVGGHCIGVDPWFLVEGAPDITPLIRTAREVNDSQPAYVVDIIRSGLGRLSSRDITGKRISLLGLAYKPEVDDLRESPALAVARLLSGEGAHVKAFEPFKKDFDVPGIEIVQSVEDAVSEVDIIVLLVAHKSLCSLDPQKIAPISTARVVVDAVNGWSAQEWIETGFQFLRLGVSSRYTNP